MPPVPKVALAIPGRVQPCPTSEACWSPAMPQMGGLPGSAVAAPTAPEESTIFGSTAAGSRSRLSRSSSQSIVVGSTSAVTAALVASVTWRVSAPVPPPLSVQATQVSTVPKHSSPLSARARSGSTSSRIAITLVADALGAMRIPSAWRARQVPTVRRSCQPMPGATGRPLARSHTMTDARAGSRCRRRRPARPRPASPSPPRARRRPWPWRRTRPGRARVCRGGPGGGARSPRWRRGARWRRAPLTCRRRRRARSRSRAYAHGAGPNGDASPNLPGLRMPWGSNVSFRPRSTSKPEPSARGKKRLRLSPMPW